VEKIKTIGDSYMAVRGIPVACRDTAGPVAALALDTIETVGAVRERWGVDVDVRIGIHTGPAVAGVIGLDRFSYDLWGDTVNTASRMESHAAPGTIQTTVATYSRLRDRYAFEGPATIDVKGKGLMPVFCLIGPRRVAR